MIYLRSEQFIRFKFLMIILKTAVSSRKKVEGLFKKNIEFSSRDHLLRELKGSMKASVLETILNQLVSENKIIVNDDHSLTWIDAEDNEKLIKAFERAVPL